MSWTSYYLMISHMETKQTNISEYFLGLGVTGMSLVYADCETKET